MNTPSLRFHRDNGEKYSNPAKLAIADVAPLQRGFDLPTSSMENGKIPVIMSNGIGGYHSVAKQKGPGVITGRSGTIGAVFIVHFTVCPACTFIHGGILVVFQDI